MSIFDCMKEVTDAASKRDAANRALQRACCNFVRSAAFYLSFSRQVASVTVEWDKEGMPIMFRAYDANSEEVRLFPSHDVERKFCADYSNYLGYLWQRGCYIVSIEFKDGVDDLLAYGLEA